MKKNKMVYIAVLAAVVILILLVRARFMKSAYSFSIIGGADGPTAVFIAGKTQGKENAEKKMNGYTQISMSEAQEIFKTKGDYIILDVRRKDEFAQGHIPGAINVANEDITDQMPEQLPDKDQTIYVYCRSGNRSKQAAAKLAAIGYTNIIEFGGIMSWPGAIEQ